nr:PREDICTED: uncharacterized protein LOC107398412 [Tribolium castaneum]|eukprot:XP_015837884.1 PREDICTED: uncharacterized protein LOC107398412 [Tribolium castaneum]
MFDWSYSKERLKIQLGSPVDGGIGAKAPATVGRKPVGIRRDACRTWTRRAPTQRASGSRSTFEPTKPNNCRNGEFRGSSPRQISGSDVTVSGTCSTTDWTEFQFFSFQMQTIYYLSPRTS